MPIAQNRKTAPTLSAKQQLIVDATEAFLPLKNKMGTAAIYALDLFVEELNKKTLTIRQARKIFEDKNQFADFLVRANEVHRGEFATAIEKATNADIAAIKRSTATRATLTTAAIFCLLSQPVSTAEVALFHMVKARVTPSAKTEKLPSVIPPLTHTDPVAKDVCDKTINLKIGPNGLYDPETGNAPSFGAGQKYCVLVEAANAAKTPAVQHRKPAIHKPKPVHGVLRHG